MPESTAENRILTSCIREEGEYRKLLEAVKKQKSAKNLPMLLTGLCSGAADILCAAICEDMPGAEPVLLLCPEEKECLHMQRLLEGFGKRCVFFPGRDINLSSLVASREYEFKRISALLDLINGNADIVTTTPDALIGYTVPSDVLASAVFSVNSDSIMAPEEMELRLVKAGYRRCELAEGPGQFARRGGIIDIVMSCRRDMSAPADSDAGRGIFAVRIEFFGDEIDRTARYDSGTQRVTENIGGFTVPPAREIIPTRDNLEQIRSQIQALLKKNKDPKSGEQLEAELSDVNAAIEGGGSIIFQDKYLPLIYPDKTTLMDYLKESGLCIVKGNAAVRERLKAFRMQLNEDITQLIEKGLIPGKYADYAASEDVYDFFTLRRPTLLIDMFGQGLSDRRLSGNYGFSSKHSVSAVSGDDMLREDIENLTAGMYRIILLCRDEKQAKEYEEKLNDGDIIARACEKGDGSDLPFSLIRPGTVTILPACPVEPFELVRPKIAILTAAGRQDNEAKPAKSTKKIPAAKRILSYNDLHTGDYVVHENHGIGRYDGITTLTVDGVTKDYITIQYAGSDRLFMPADALDKVSKYIGARSDTENVKLSKFGGTEWGRTKARTKSALRDIAKELIKLYAERMRRPGFAFTRDDEFQRSFEAAFEYEETEAQKQAINEIKADMMKAAPMDRLLCGDVGYGKTEVAFRAAYKAVLDSKQVAILVPTTILALQHYRTASARMRDTAVSVGMLSRFVKPGEQKEIRERLKKGTLDIVIGTHSLLSKNVEFKDLGLLIVDEEQRFGVAQKEKIKQRTGNIDVLSLSATPIPRTLNMAMSGIRDISLLDEAPGSRLPVQTYVMEHNDILIMEAIRRELRRGGQVFYLYNFVDSIDAAAAKIRDAIPEARVVTAHGKMDKDTLEDIWRDMTEGKIDILVSTTIIESGVDVPNANTLIVQNAHRLGLSQLHQLRGRVGRSARRAYAYFTFPRDLALNEIQQKRLEAIKEYAEFGAGFQIAMRDLELRGAGSVLGAEQSGHLDEVGYDLYVKLLGEAILEEKGEKKEEEKTCTVTLSVSAFIPDSFVPSAPQRMALYKRLAHVSSKKDADDIADEICDRFGEPPASVMNLIDIALLRAEAADCGLASVTQESNGIRITQTKFDVFLWQDMQKLMPGRLKIFLSPSAYVFINTRPSDDTVALSLTVTEKFAELKKSAGKD